MQDIPREPDGVMKFDGLSRELVDKPLREPEISGRRVGGTLCGQIPVCENRPENVIYWVMVDWEFVPALRALNLTWWYLGDRRRRKRGVAYTTFRRWIPRAWTGKPCEDEASPGYNLQLHRVIAVGIRRGAIPLSFAELVTACENVGVVKVTDPWDYRASKLVVEQGTGVPTKHGPGIRQVTVPDDAAAPPRTYADQEACLDNALISAVGEIEFLPASLFHDPVGIEAGMEINHAAADARALAVAKKHDLNTEIEDLVSKL